MKSSLRKRVLQLCLRSGVIDLWRYVRRKDIVVLMLHGTADPNRKSDWNPLRRQHSPEQLEWCLTILKEYYRFISLEEAVGILKGERPTIDRGMVITCDDGYRSNIDDALPIFSRHGVPIAVFLPTSYVENRLPLWFDRLDYAIQNAPVDGLVFTVGGTPCRFSAESRDALVSSYARFRALVKDALEDESLFVSQIDEVIAFVERSGGKSLVELFENDPWSGLLGWEEIRKVQGNGVCFGSHTMDHSRLGFMDEQAARRQLAESKKMIEGKTGRECAYLAYPNGIFSDRVAMIARECGYDAALTTVEGLNRVGCDLMKLKRVNMPSTDDPAELLARVSGFSEVLSRLNEPVIG